ncbi:uncharacterized protein LOC135502236 [Lineus longissimus]|uniref:uncharacterized protein LOC135502236 n=1 Tax=Lineus longissimus TaxID=88925 RepID=UPI002B4C8F1B
MTDYNSVYNSSTIWAANTTNFNRTIKIYSKEQEQAAIYVIAVVMTYACSIFALLTLVLCKKKPGVVHTDRDVDRFLRDIESVRDALRKRDQKYEVNRFIRGISTTTEGELARSHSMDASLESKGVRIKPPLRRAVSEVVRAAKFADAAASSFEAVSSDSETSLSPMFQTMVNPPSYEELKMKSRGGLTDRKHCQNCSCHLIDMRHQIHFVSVPVLPPRTEVALVHQPSASVRLSNLTGERNQPSLPNVSHSNPVSQKNGRMLHSSSGPTRIPRPVITTTMPPMPFINENEEHGSLRTETGPLESKRLQFTGRKLDMKGCVSPGETSGKLKVLNLRRENDSNRNRVNSTDDEPTVTSPLIGATAL